METTLDRFGRIIIPKDVRDDMALEPGAVLRIERDGEKILLAPLRAEPQLVDKKGVLVFAGTATGDIVAAVRDQRRGRLRKVGLGHQNESSL